jgi:hypothetical protein
MLMLMFPISHALLIILATVVVLADSSPSSSFYADDVPYDLVLWPGTHNSAINLGQHTVFKPSGAEEGKYPSEAHLHYQYLVMDQRLSVRDQLEQGIRVLDFELASLVDTKWECQNNSITSTSTNKNNGSEQKCIEKITFRGRCFENCPFVILHGSLEQSIGGLFGYTFPSDLFTTIAAFVHENPLEIVTIMMMASHGKNRFPKVNILKARLESSGLLSHVYNYDSNFTLQGIGNNSTLFRFPTLGEMRKANRTVLLLWDANYWTEEANYPKYIGNVLNAKGFEGADQCTGVGQIEEGEEEEEEEKGSTVASTMFPCNSGWDSVTFANLSPSRAALSANQVDAIVSKTTPSIFAIENLSSRRGRNNTSFSYTSLPNELTDLPFQGGGNPAQAMLAADYDHIVALEKSYANLLEKYGNINYNITQHANWMLVDFYNTTNQGAPASSSRTIVHNPNDGLLRACRDITEERIGTWRKERNF